VLKERGDDGLVEVVPVEPGRLFADLLMPICSWVKQSSSRSVSR